MAHDHLEVEGPATGHRLVPSIVLTLAFVAGEAAVGFWAQSLALVSDAGHNLADALALIFSWAAIRVARRPSHERMTFGYHRAGILAALANSLSLVALAVYIFWEAYDRLRDPRPVSGGPMILVALVAIALNVVISLWLRDEAGRDLNIRSAYLHMLGDALSALGVVAAGILVELTGNPIADPIVSILIGGLILASSYGILGESINVLFEGVPQGFDMGALERAIADSPGVLGAHDLHVWTVGPGVVACSCHILISEQSARGGEQVLSAVSAMVRERFNVAHTTIQVEVEGCDPDHFYCSLDRRQDPRESLH